MQEVMKNIAIFFNKGPFAEKAVFVSKEIYSFNRHL